MTTNGKAPAKTAMLDLWRPPRGAGDPVGCLATTYTFAPELFDEQCLARFLEIESEPDREGLAYLLERESRLDAIYSGVLVDHAHAGVAHSLRWDVLPVRVPTGIQHAKLSLLAWAHHVRIIVASANLTEAGYRCNQEVAAAVDLRPDSAPKEMLAEALGFLRWLVACVPGASDGPPEVLRAEAFIERVEGLARAWSPAGRDLVLRQRLAFTQPAGAGTQARSALEEAIGACRSRGRSPDSVRVASPFFDEEEGAKRTTAALCRLMARGGGRRVSFSVPARRDASDTAAVRLAAPIALLRTPPAYDAQVSFETLPEVDDRNHRPWHAKLVMLGTDDYSALMIGSSNFTLGGMGLAPRRNAEANLLTVADRIAYGREAGQLDALWPRMESVDDPESAEWLGPRADEDEEGTAAVAPPGFLSASYRAGTERRVILRLDPPHLPADWSVDACGSQPQPLASASTWRAEGALPRFELDWSPHSPPEKLVVRWAGHEAPLPLNVETARDLPPPAQLENMSAEDMLEILAASDPSAAFRVWARRQGGDSLFDSELDSAMPVDLDPLRRYDLRATFLHRVRRRARILAQLRANLQRPAWSRRSLEWRLHGLIGVGALADRLVRDVESVSGPADEPLLTLADFLVVLQEVEYQALDGALSKREFDGLYRPFLRALAASLDGAIQAHRGRMSGQVAEFWGRVVERCQD